jgi:hypothetical protein
MVVLPEGIGAGVGVGAGVGGASVVQGTCTNGGRSVKKVAFGAARSVLLLIHPSLGTRPYSQDDPKCGNGE